MRHERHVPEMHAYARHAMRGMHMRVMPERHAIKCTPVGYLPEREACERGTLIAYMSLS